MRIIISPAKRMRIEHDALDYRNLPQFMEKTEVLLEYLKGLSYEEAKTVWQCNDKIADLNYHRIHRMDLYSNLTPAVLAYEGIQYQHLAPGIFSAKEFDYLEEHLRIMSGFYGVLRPFDGVTPYRLEMQARLQKNAIVSLYDFWGDLMAQSLFSESNCIVNLASKEYSTCITKYLDSHHHLVTCVFGEMVKGRVVEKGTMVKMARGAMVRHMVELQIQDVRQIKGFRGLNFVFSEELSNDNIYVFLKGEGKDAGNIHEGAKF